MPLYLRKAAFEVPGAVLTALHLCRYPPKILFRFEKPCEPGCGLCAEHCLWDKLPSASLGALWEERRVRAPPWGIWRGRGAPQIPSQQVAALFCSQAPEQVEAETSRGR